MALTCNIDNRGRVVRLIYGLVLIIISIIVAIRWAAPTQSVVMWIVAVSCAIAGAFGIFESVKGWCVMRAMGYKTPL